MMTNDLDTVLTVDTVLQFYSILQSRAEINLKNAEERHDVKAVYNIKRKIAIYKYTIEKLQERG